MKEGQLSAEARLLRESRAGRLLLVSAVVVGFLAAAILVAETVLLSVVVDRVFLGHAGLSAVQALLVVMLCLVVLRGGLVWAEAVVGQRSSSIYKGRLRAQLTGRLLALGPAYTADERSGELTNTAVEGVETLDAYIAQYLPARLLAGAVPALVFLVVLVMDPVTTLAYVVAGPMLILLLALIGGRAKAMTDQRFAELSWLSAHFLDVLQGLPTLKLFGRSREQAANIETISRHYGNTTMDVLRTAFQTSLVQEWAATAATALVALEVSLRLMDHALPYSTALAVLLLTPEFFLPLRQMALMYHAGTAGKAAAERVYEVLDVPSPGISPGILVGEPRAPGFPRPARAGLPVPLRMDLCFQDVTYAYDGGQRPALRGLAFAIAEGQTVALVGATGAGKSTVANLLLRFIEPDGGSIIAGGVPLSTIEPAAWRTRVAWVAQHPYLFNGTVAENIGLAKPEARPDEIVAAAAAAHADDFIRDLPRGYDTPLGEQGARLSGGQRQRLAIARAFLKDAPLLILDEATVHLDATSEALLQAALRRLMLGRTALVIAHRLKMAYTADQIVVLDRGRAAEVGTHPELLARGGLYREMVATYEAAALPHLAARGGLA